MSAAVVIERPPRPVIPPFDNLLTHPAFAGMRRVRQWVVWKLVEDEKRGKWTKHPAARNGHAPVNAGDPRNWSDAATAAVDAARLGPEFGIGFYFSKGCGYWFCDLDSAYRNGEWSQFAKDVATWFASAAVETSVNGAGLHLFGSGAVPLHENKCAKENAEFYTCDRFAAMTGTHARGDCDTDHSVVLSWFVPMYFPHKVIEPHALPDDGPRPEWVGPADDEALLQIMLAKPEHNPFRRDPVTTRDLWECNGPALAKRWPHEHEEFDRSSADASLAQRLAFYTGCDAQRMDRLMRESALWRDKYDDRGDYLARTINKARQRQKDVLIVKPGAAEVLTQLRQMDPNDIAASWIALAVDLPKADTEEVVSLVANFGIGSRSVLKAALKDARDAAARERNEHEFAERHSDRALIEHRPGATYEQAQQVAALIAAGAKPGEFVSFAGGLARVTVAPLPLTHAADDPEGDAPAVPQIERLTRAAAVAYSERVAQFFDVTVTGRKKPVDVPDGVVSQLLDSGHHAAPVIAGIVTHPLVRSDGAILGTDGLHGRLFLQSGLAFGALQPYTQSEARDALSRLRGAFLAGFEFASPLDADAAIAGLLTGIQRRMLPSAPGLAVIASTQASGKTTLARRLHLLLTGCDMPVSPFPLNDEPEMSKRLLSALMRNPAAVIFDNIGDGQTLASPSLAAAMTAPVFTSRILGESRDVSAPTAVLFVATGNNLNFGNDEATRWLTTRLAPSCARPEERRFVQADVVGHARQVRTSVLHDAVRLVAGYLCSGAAPIGVGARFPEWDRQVRQAMLWAGAADVATVFRANAANSEGVNAFHVLTWALMKAFGVRPFKSGELVAAMQGANAYRDTLRTALESLGVREVDKARSVGQKLAALRGKVADVEGQQIRLDAFEDSHDKLMRYRLQMITGG